MSETLRPISSENVVQASDRSIDPKEVSFGQMLKAFRQRLSLSQLKMAAMLGVDDSTINRIEAGSRKPPRNVEFYDKLKTIPGLTESEILLLLSTEQVPRWLHRLKEEITPSTPQRDVISPAQGIIIPLFIEREILSDEEIEILKSDITLSVQYLLFRRRAVESLSQTPITPILPQNLGNMELPLISPRDT